MEKNYSKNMTDQEKDSLFLYTCTRLCVDTENDVLVDVVVELAAQIKELQKTEFGLKRKIEFKEKEAEHFKSMFYGKQKLKDKIRDINIITINNTINNLCAADGECECGTEKDMDQA